MSVNRPPFKPRLIDGYEFDEVSSALNKAIRRNDEYSACFWGYVICQSNFGAYLWRRLLVITSEDIGNADVQASLLLHALRTGWETMHKHTKEPTAAKLALVFQMIQYLCNAQKVRDIDSLRNLIWKRYERGERLEIPTLALDPHCARGRLTTGRFGDFKDGRERERLKRWYAESSVVIPEAYPNKWLKPLQQIEEEIISEEESKLKGKQ